MPAYPHIERYRAELERLIEYGGSDNESSIRRAFAGCLDSYCRDHRERLALVDELAFRGGVYPDGTVKDSLRMARGYWEAKDVHDDLDAEIQAKFNRGYPRDNIIFEDSETAVLVKDGEAAAVIVGMQEYVEALERLEDLEDLEMLNEMQSKPLEFGKLEHFTERASEKTNTGGTPSFASRWRGQFSAAERDDARYDALAKKYLK